MIKWLLHIIPAWNIRIYHQNKELKINIKINKPLYIWPAPALILLLISKIKRKMPQENEYKNSNCHLIWGENRIHKILWWLIFASLLAEHFTFQEHKACKITKSEHKQMGWCVRFLKYAQIRIKWNFSSGWWCTGSGEQQVNCKSEINSKHKV